MQERQKREKGEGTTEWETAEQEKENGPAGKRARSRAGSAEKRLAKKLDAMCLLISGAVIAVTAWLEYRDRSRNGPAAAAVT